MDEEPDAMTVTSEPALVPLVAAGSADGVHHYKHGWIPLAGVALRTPKGPDARPGRMDVYVDGEVAGSIEKRTRTGSQIRGRVGNISVGRTPDRTEWHAHLPGQLSTDAQSFKSRKEAAAYVTAEHKASKGSSPMTPGSDPSPTYGKQVVGTDSSGREIAGRSMGEDTKGTVRIMPDKGFSPTHVPAGQVRLADGESGPAAPAADARQTADANIEARRAKTAAIIKEAADKYAQTGDSKHLDTIARAREAEQQGYQRDLHAYGGPDTGIGQMERAAAPTASDAGVSGAIVPASNDAAEIDQLAADGSSNAMDAGFDADTPQGESAHAVYEAITGTEGSAADKVRAGVERAQQLHQDNPDGDEGSRHVLASVLHADAPAAADLISGGAPSSSYDEPPVNPVDTDHDSSQYEKVADYLDQRLGQMDPDDPDEEDAYLATESAARAATDGPASLSDQELDAAYSELDDIESTDALFDDTDQATALREAVGAEIERRRPDSGMGGPVGDILNRQQGQRPGEALTPEPTPSEPPNVQDARATITRYDAAKNMGRTPSRRSKSDTPSTSGAADDGPRPGESAADYGRRTGRAMPLEQAPDWTPGAQADKVRKPGDQAGPAAEADGLRQRVEALKSPSGRSAKMQRAFQAANEGDYGWLQAHGFDAQPGDTIHVSDESGRIAIDRPGSDSHLFYQVNGNGQAVSRGGRGGVPVPKALGPSEGGLPDTFRVAHDPGASGVPSDVGGQAEVDQLRDRVSMARTGRSAKMQRAFTAAEQGDFGWLASHGFNAGPDTEIYANNSDGSGILVFKRTDGTWSAHGVNGNGRATSPSYAGSHMPGNGSGDLPDGFIQVGTAEGNGPLASDHNATGRDRLTDEPGRIQKLTGPGSASDATRFAPPSGGTRSRAARNAARARPDDGTGSRDYNVMRSIAMTTPETRAKMAASKQRSDEQTLARAQRDFPVGTPVAYGTGQAADPPFNTGTVTGYTSGGLLRIRSDKTGKELPPSGFQHPSQTTRLTSFSPDEIAHHSAEVPGAGAPPSANRPTGETVQVNYADAAARINEALRDGGNANYNADTLDTDRVQSALRDEPGKYVTIKPPGGYEVSISRADAESLLRARRADIPKAPAAEAADTAPALSDTNRLNREAGWTTYKGLKPGDKIKYKSALMTEAGARSANGGEWMEVVGRGIRPILPGHVGEGRSQNTIMLRNAAGETKTILANQGSRKVLVYRGAGATPTGVTVKSAPLDPEGDFVDARYDVHHNDKHIGQVSRTNEPVDVSTGPSRIGRFVNRDIWRAEAPGLHVHDRRSRKDAMIDLLEHQGLSYAEARQAVDGAPKAPAPPRG